jgi:hypothetical protein
MAPASSEAPRSLLPNGHAKAAPVDGIRAALHEQRKASVALRSNALFRELAEEDRRPQLLHAAGGTGLEDAPAPILDLEGEAQTRMMHAIQRAAAAASKPQQGLWCSPLQPYVCCGEPATVSGGWGAPAAWAGRQVLSSRLRSGHDEVGAMCLGGGAEAEGMHTRMSVCVVRAVDRGSTQA